MSWKPTHLIGQSSIECSVCQSKLQSFLWDEKNLYLVGVFCQFRSMMCNRMFVNYCFVTLRRYFPDCLQPSQTKTGLVCSVCAVFLLHALCMQCETGPRCSKGWAVTLHMAVTIIKNNCTAPHKKMDLLPGKTNTNTVTLPELGTIEHRTGVYSQWNCSQKISF